MHQNLIGTAVIFDPDRSDSDYAFVETTTGIDDDIFLNGDDTYEVTSSATVTEHSGGQFLYAMGSVSGLEYGNIDGTLPSIAMITTTIPVVNGDSGGPVFKHGGSGSTGYTATIYGHTLTPTAYQKVDKVVGFGIIPKS